jgi:hypothetical protein
MVRASSGALLLLPLNSWLRLGERRVSIVVATAAATTTTVVAKMIRQPEHNVHKES